MDIVSFFKDYFEFFIGIIGTGAGLYWKFADRARSIHKDKLRILQPILKRPLNEHHDLVLETVFRLCFGETIPAFEVRFLFDNKFTLNNIEDLCKTREHLHWDENLETYKFNKINQVYWFRWTRIIVYIILYILFFWLAIQCIDANKLKHLLESNNIVVQQIILLVLVVSLLLSMAFFFLWLGSRLFRADRFMKNLPKNSKTRNIGRQHNT